MLISLGPIFPGDQLNSERVRIDHLLHLVRCAELEEDERKGLIASLEADTPTGNARKHALDRLEQLDPTIRERLRALWTAYGRQTLFLFKTPALVEWTEGDGRRELLRALKQSGMSTQGFRADGTWLVVPRPDSDEDDPQAEATSDGSDLSKARVYKVALEGSVLSAIVRIKRSITVVQEDEEIVVPFTYDVQVVIDLASPAKLARIFGAQTDGRRALRTVLRFLGLDVPERGRRVPQFMTPVSITEPKLRALALKQKWEWVDVNGEDAAGKLGRIGYSGKTPTPLRRAALDMSDKRIMAQDVVPNESRTYNFKYVHSEDGFEEVSEAEFLFGVRQTRFGFPRRATRPAMDYVISLVYAHVT